MRELLALFFVIVSLVCLAKCARVFSADLKASFCEASATSSCNNWRSWRYREVSGERTSHQALIPRFSSGMAPRWLLFYLEIGITFNGDKLRELIKLGTISPDTPDVRFLFSTLSFLRTCFIEVYASVALEELGLFLVAEVEHQDLLGQGHVLSLLLRWVRKASSASLAPRFYRFASPLANGLEQVRLWASLRVFTRLRLLWNHVKWTITGSQGPRQYFTLHWKITP